MESARTRATGSWKRLGIVAAVWFPLALWAGGSGLNTVVVVNQASSNSLALGNDYCERRQVPPQNLLRIHWPGGNIAWTLDEFQSTLATPLQALLAGLSPTNPIDYVVLSMDIPYRVTSSNGANSTTSVLFYGFKADTASSDPLYPSCSLPPTSSNSYAFSEGIFRMSPPDTAPGRPVLAMMLTAESLASARAILEQGVASDATMPTQTVYLAKTSDVFRTVRFVLFDDAIFNARLLGDNSLMRINSDSPAGATNLLGYQTGLAQFNISPGAFVPGAMADSLTSFGGMIFEASGQTSLLAFLQAGAAGSFGTVVEPCNYLEKFPSPLDYFYQARGFSLAECYYLSVQNPHQGLLVGEPLAAPFAQPGHGAWANLPVGAMLAGTTNLSLDFYAGQPSRPLQQVDLFVDGALAGTITNIPPAPGNLLSVVIRGLTHNYVVPPNAAIRDVATGLAELLNASSNLTQVTAAAMGDRVELQWYDAAIPGDQVSISASGFAGGAPGLTTFVRASRGNFLDGTAFAACYLGVTNQPGVGDWLQLDIVKTNGVHTVLASTNTDGTGTVWQLALDIINQVNASSALQAPDGVVAEDYVSLASYGQAEVYLTIRARTAGLGLARMQANLSGSPSLSLLPQAGNRLDANLADLQPRNHLYVTAGATNLSFSFPFDTTALADGYHTLTAVAYEGSHVRTQTRAVQDIRIRNSTLEATLTNSAPLGAAGLEDTLQFTVTASTNAVAVIELFGSGGSLGRVSNRQPASFSVAATNLGEGLHPFYALVTDNHGHSYRTDTQWIRLSALPPALPFSVTIAGHPLRLTWPALSGHSYDILSTDDLTAPFEVRDTVRAATTGSMEWTEPQPGAGQRFYRVRSGP